MILSFPNYIIVANLEHSCLKVFLYGYGDVIDLELFVSWNRSNIDSTLFKTTTHTQKLHLGSDHVLKMKRRGSLDFSLCKVGFYSYFYLLVYLPVIFHLQAGLTSLHLAAQEDKVNVAEILTKHGANQDAQTKVNHGVAAVSSVPKGATLVQGMFH